MERISAVIITFNEERNIARCIDSLAGVADEIVVVDSFSTDTTQSICASRNVRFLQHSFQGYIEQKNFAMEQASLPFVLSLDADEALSEPLRQSILAAKSGEMADGYSFNRMTNYCGMWIRHGGWYPDTKIRLVRKSVARWAGENPHDRLELDKGARRVKLRGDLLHYSYYTVEEHDRQIDRFTQISAKALFNAGLRSSSLKVFYKPAARFLRDYFFRMGFMDGVAGWTIACRSYTAARLKYQRLLDYQRNIAS